MARLFPILFSFLFMSYHMADMHIHVPHSRDRTCSSEETLISDIMSNYNRIVRPCSYGRAVEVKIGFNLLNINDLEEVTGKFSVLGFFYIAWKDPRISWKDSAYNGTRVLFLPQNMVWKPELFLRNSFTRVQQFGTDEMIVHYLPSGHAAWQPGDLLESICDVNVEKYPFDRQTCSMTFLSWGYTTDQIRFNLINDRVNLDYFNRHGIWDVIGTKASTYTKTRLQYIQFDIIMERRPNFAMINMIYPVLILSIMNVFVFLVPAGSGEKISYSLSLLLSTVVFLTLVSENLPKTSKPKISFVCYTLLGNVVISASIILCTILGLRIYNKTKDVAIPRVLKAVARCGKMRKKEYVVNDVRDVTWNDVGVLYDKICFIFFVSMLVVNYSLYFIYLRKDRFVQCTEPANEN